MSEPEKEPLAVPSTYRKYGPPEEGSLGCTQTQLVTLRQLLMPVPMVIPINERVTAASWFLKSVRLATVHCTLLLADVTKIMCMEAAVTVLSAKVRFPEGMLENR